MVRRSIIWRTTLVIIVGDEDRRTSPVELLWDLVFVFAITQVTTLIANDLTWAGFGHGMIVLALVWWAWSAFVWAANAEEERSRAFHGILLLGMMLVFVAGLALPSAFRRGDAVRRVLRRGSVAPPRRCTRMRRAAATHRGRRSAGSRPRSGSA